MHLELKIKEQTIICSNTARCITGGNTEITVMHGATILILSDLILSEGRANPVEVFFEDNQTFFTFGRSIFPSRLSTLNILYFMYILMK